MRIFTIFPKVIGSSLTFKAISFLKFTVCYENLPLNFDEPIADFRKPQRRLPSLLDRITYYLYAQRLSHVGAYVVTL